MTFEPTDPDDLPVEQPAELQAINNAIDALGQLEELPSPSSPMAAATIALAWSNIALAIGEVNRNASAKHAAQTAVDWLANPSPEGFELFRAAVDQYLALR